MAKKFIRILAVGLALAMCLAMAVPAFAAEGDLVSESGKVYFDKDLVMPKDATVPDAKFDFVLGANDRGDGILVEGWEVHTGIFNLKVEEEETEPAPEPPTQEEEEVETDLQAAYSVSFDATHPTTPGSEREGAIADKDHKYATESFSIDFNGVDWPEPGIYRYVLKETEGDLDGIEYTDKVFYIDVYIVSDDDGNLSIGNIVVTEDDFLEPDPENNGSDDTNEDGVVDNPSIPKKEDGTKIDASGPKDPEEDPGEEPQEPEEGVVNPEDKIPGDEDPDPNDPNANTGVNKGQSQADFINTYEPLKLTLSKTVKGNQGSRIDYFEFTIELDLTGLDLSDGVYKIVGTTGDDSDAYLIVRDGVGTATVNLKHGQSISILVPYDTEYTITESSDVANADAYRTSTAADAAKSTFDWTALTIGAEEDKTVTASEMDEDVEVAFVNHKEGTIPTGVLMTIAPFAALMGVGLAGGAIVLKKKRED